MDAGLLFQNAKIKSREAELFGKEKMQRLADASTREEAMRILQEGGYPAGTDANEILASAEIEATEFFRSAAVSGYGLECFLVMNDYHNAKVAAKKVFFDSKSASHKPSGLLDVKIFEENLRKDDLGAFPAPMQEAFSEIKKVSASGALMPSAVDVLLDKAAFKDVHSRFSSAHPSVKEYFTRLSDFANLAVAYRSHRAGLSAPVMESMLVTEGEISRKDCKKLFELGVEEGAEKVSLSGVYKGALAALKEGTAAFETYCDNVLLAPIKKARFDMFSPAAVIGFYLGKLREIKNIRILFARINNGVSKDLIKVRLREQYV